MLAASLLAACGSSAATTTAAGDSGNGGPSTSKTVKVTISQRGCAPEAQSYDAGALTFQINNSDATGTSEIELRSGERIIGEKGLS